MAGKMASRKKKEKAFNVLAFFIVLILAALVLLPIWWIFRSSLMSTAALNEYPPSFIPHEWLWSNYSKALETFEYWTYFKNTFTIIIPAVTFGTIDFLRICLCKTSLPREKADLQHLCWHDSSSGNGNLDSSVYFLDKGNGTG